MRHGPKLGVRITPRDQLIENFDWNRSFGFEVQVVAEKLEAFEFPAEINICSGWRHIEVGAIEHVFRDLAGASLLWRNRLP